MEKFSHTNLDVSEIKRKFEKEMNPTMEESPQVPALPYFNPKKYYGQYKTYQEAKVFIEERKWYGLSYNQMRFTCTSASHTTTGSNKLRQSKNQARPLVFLVYYTKMFLTINTGKYLAKDERKYFLM